MTRRAAKVDRNQREIVDDLGIDTTNNAYRDAGRKICAHCGAVFHSYLSRKFCGLDCYSKSRTFVQEKPCVQCSKPYKPRTSRQKYCGIDCMRAARPRVCDYKPRPKPVYMMTCMECGSSFRYSPSQKRKFCSYSCHLQSGGAKRAGRAAAMAMPKYGAKKDANHKEVFDAIMSVTVAKDLSTAGCGVPDGLAWVCGQWMLFDVKNPKTGYGKRGLNPRQKDWATDWKGGPVYLIYSADEGRRFARGELEGIKYFPPDAALRSGVVEIPLRGVIS